MSEDNAAKKKPAIPAPVTSTKVEKRTGTAAPSATQNKQGISPKRISLRLGEVLIKQGKLSEEQLVTALAKAKMRKALIGQILVSEGYITDIDLAKAMAIQMRLKYSSLEDFAMNPEIIAMLPEKIAKKHIALPLAMKGDILLVGIDNPHNVVDINIVKQFLKQKTELVVCPESRLRRLIEKAYTKEGDTISHIANKLIKGVEKEKAERLALQQDVEDDSQDKKAKYGSISVDNLIDEIIENALGKAASDIHIEPTETIVNIRLRINGVLFNAGTIPLDLYDMVVSKFKILCHLDIAEKRKPQDGSFRHTWGSRVIDMRFSTLPIVGGEKIVMRILDKSALKVDITQLGINENLVDQIVNVTKKPFGIIYVTGPTGSGKTTTVYSILNLFDKIQKNLITVEDPVEFNIEGINQVQINPKAGLTFASTLKSILRQDPDTIMVGETRDKETAEIAVRASLTGHMVISTLHTNDSVSSITRLIDMGVEPFLVASSLVGVIAQRLVRILCDNCKTTGPIDPKKREMYGVDLLPDENMIVGQAVGCSKCNNSGFVGRRAIFELLTLNIEVKEAITAGKTEQEILAILRKTGFKTMRENAVEKIEKQMTTLEEVLKHTF